MNSELLLKAVIFDCDGVLVDTEPLHYRAFQEVLVPLGLGFHYDHYLKHYIGFDDRDAFLEAFRERNRPVDPETLGRLIASKGEALLRIIAGGISSFPGVVPLVKELARKGIPLAVASGALRSEVELFLRVLGIQKAFSVIVAADEVTRSKPDPETYVAVLEHLRREHPSDHLEPRHCIAIEDTPTGIQSARGAGLFVIGVSNSFPASTLRGQADHVVESLAHLTGSELEQLLRKAGPMEDPVEGFDNS